MKSAVRLYRDVPGKHKAMPGDWPAEFRDDFPDGDPVPAPWIEMSAEEYNAYRDEHSAKYNAYLQWHDPEGKWRVGKLPHHYAKRAWRKMTGRF